MDDNDNSHDAVNWNDNNNDNNVGDDEWLALNLDPPFVRQEIKILTQLKVLKIKMTLKMWMTIDNWNDAANWNDTNNKSFADDEWHWPSLNLDPAFVRQETEIPTPSGHYHRFACVVLRLKGSK